MRSGRRTFIFPLVAAAAIFVAVCASFYAASAHDGPSTKTTVQRQPAMSGGMGRLYVFRPIRSFGAHIDDYITVNGVPVRLVTPGTGFYCDVPAGDYVIGVVRHKTYPLKVSVTAGQTRYVCVMLHHLGGVAPRGGALNSDQSFDVRLLEPDYGAERVEQYPLTRAKCQH